ncbi:MAG: hypothetical protein GY851_08855 [bacterium]|nr:hypothetical protein [bacterium]
MSTQTRDLRFLMARHQDTEVLLLPGGDGCTLPVYDEPVPQNVGFSDPTPFNDWFGERFGVRVMRRYALDHEGTDAAVFVVESLSPDAPEPEGASWMRASDLDSTTFAREEHRVFLRDWFASSGESATMPWAKPGGHEDAFAWMDRVLEEHGIQRQGPAAQVKNAYVSCVFRCPTTGGDVYLKTLPSLFVREIQIMEKLAEWGIAELPDLIAADADRGYMLTRDMGGCDLADCFSLELLIEAARRTAEIQVASCDMIDPEKPWPFYDWRIPALADGIESVVDEMPRLLGDSPYRLTDDELCRLRERIPHWRSLCAEIQELGLPDAVDHADVRPGNIRIVDGRLILYDWSFSAVTHPFFSPVGLMHIVRRQVDQNTGAKDRVRDAYLEPWTPFAPRDALLRAFDLADELKVLYGTAGDADWLRAILNAIPDKNPAQTHPDSWTLGWRRHYFAKMARRLL